MKNGIVPGFDDDFKIKVLMPAIAGNGGVPDFDFELRFRTCHGEYVAGRFSGVLRNCIIDGDDLVVSFKNPGFEAYEEIICDAVFHIPDEAMPDGIKDIRRRYETGILLGNASGMYTYGVTAEFTALLPYIKGDKGDSLKYSDLTDEEREELASDVAGAMGDIASCECEPIGIDEIKNLFDSTSPDDGGDGSAPCAGFEPIAGDDVKKMWNETDKSTE